MSDRYRGTIEFPASALADDEIKEVLDKEGVRFGFKGETPTAEFDLEVQINDGIFLLTAPEVAWGQFEDLEDLLKIKEIPFDRESDAFFDMIPERVIYRPAKDGAPAQYLCLMLMNDEPYVSVQTIRELLALDDAGEEAASAIRHYLDENFPAYPPLADYVKEA